MYRSSSSIGNDINNLFWSFLAFFWKSQEFCLAKGHSRGHVELSLHERCWFDWHFYTNFLNFSDSAQKYSVGEVEKNSCFFFYDKTVFS